MAPAPEGRTEYIEGSVKVAQILNGPVLPPDVDLVREKAAQAFDRGLCPAGTARQLAAVLCSGSRKEALKSVSVRTLVIHGNEDPLVPVEGGRDTAESIAGAKLLIVDGMGHDLPQAKWQIVIEAIAAHAQ